MSDTKRPLDKQSVLAAHDFFKGLPEATLGRLGALCRTANYRAGSRIFAKGDEGFGLLAILDGLVRISVMAEDGRELILNLIGSGELFGEIALLDGLPRTADASALTDCRMIVLDRRAFQPLLAEEPAIAIRLLEVVSRRLRRTSEQLEGLSFQPPSARLAKILLRLAELQHAGAADYPRVTMTQRELGQTIGLSREGTNKQLRLWQAAGIVAIEKGGCVLRDPEALRRIEQS